MIGLKKETERVELVLVGLVLLEQKVSAEDKASAKPQLVRARAR
jgi:hypothetical protein